MTYPHWIRKFANKLLAPFSVALVPAEKPQWLRSETATVQVGRYSIQVPGISPMVTHYSKYPDSSGHLGRMTRLLKQKFPDLAAIDIGANVGDTACIIKSAADVPLLCIEGDVRIFPFLQKNLRQFQNAAAYQLFLGERTETLAANLDNDGWNATLKPDKANAAPKIKIMSLDDFLAGRPHVDKYKLVKIDTEGFDCPIIRGAKKFIQQVHPVITFEYNRDNMESIGEQGQDTLEMLAGFGYSQVVFHDNAGRFFCPASLSDHALLRDLHDYADGKQGAICYFDLTVFHERDRDLAQAFVEAERMSRVAPQTVNKP